MKKYIIPLIACMSFALLSFGQSPDGFNYQAVARDAGDNIIVDDVLSLRFWILEDNAFGVPVYQEEHENVQTGPNGVFTLKIGMGNTLMGDFSTIDWSHHDYYLRIDMDVEGGTNYSQMGVSQLLTVPYAMYAKNTGDINAIGWGNQIVESNNTLIGDGTTNNPLAVDIDVVNTDNQTLTINSNQLSISGGNTVSIPLGGNDADADPQNELQELGSLKNGEEVTLVIDGGIDDAMYSTTIFNIADADSNPANEIQNLTSKTEGSDVTVDITEGAGTTFNINDPDPDPTNEIQDLSNQITGSDVTLNISNGTSTTFTVNDADADPVNELQNLGNQKLGSDVTLSITKASGTTFNVNDADADPTNELQDLGSQTSGSNVTLNISNGASTTFNINDPDPNPMNEIQSLSLLGNDLSISGANTVSLPLGSSLWQSSGYTGIFYPGEVSVSTTNVFDALTVNGGGYFYDGWGGTSGTSIISPLGLIDLTGSNSYSPTVFIGETGWGMLDLHYDGIHSIYMDAGTYGYFESYGSYSINTHITALNGYDEHGYISVFDGSGYDRAGLYVDSYGDGVLWADLKYFRMDHPEKANKEIWYASLEGPEAAAYERGTAQLINGEFFIEFTDHFTLVINEKDMTVMITPLSAESLGLAVVEKTNSGFRVKELYKGTGNYSFDWEVKAKRKGYEDYKVVRDKGLIKGGEAHGNKNHRKGKER